MKTITELLFVKTLITQQLKDILMKRGVMAAGIPVEPLSLNKFETLQREKDELQACVVKAVTLLKVATAKQIR